MVGERLQQMLALLQQSVGAMQGTLAEVQVSQADVQTTLARIESIQAVQHVQRANDFKRVVNGGINLTTTPFQVLDREVQDAIVVPPNPPLPVQFGLPPPNGIFPLNREVLDAWTTHNPFDALQAFYGVPFQGGTVAQRRHAFLKFIGCNV